jgi:IMP dehydrogenase/GMP reductase
LNADERIQYALDHYRETEKLLLEANFYQNAPEWLTREFAFGVSVGVQQSDHERFKALYDAGACLFTVDVAHGHHILVKKMIQYMRDSVGEAICIVAGNVATSEAATALKEWGADIIKVGIGPGSVCETRKNTGVGVPQLKAIRVIRRALPNTPLIADGGIKHNGDLPKALKYANAVMVGSLVAGTSETPGHVYQNDQGEFYKVYGGSASGERKVENGGNNSFVEGVIKLVPFKGKVKYILRKANDAIRSSMSYSGVADLSTFRSESVLEDIGSGGKSESKL